MSGRRPLAPELIQGRAEDIEWMLDTGETTERIVTRAGFPTYNALITWLARHHLSALQQRVRARRIRELGRDYATRPTRRAGRNATGSGSASTGQHARR